MDSNTPSATEGLVPPPAEPVPPPPRSATPSPEPVASPSVSRYNVLGVGISALTLEGARDLIVSALRSRGTRKLGYVCLATAHGLSEARADPAYRRILNRSWLTTPDGMPLAWLGPRGVGRVYGPDLLLAVCAAGRAAGLRHYFYGGKVGVSAELAARLAERFPGLDVAGHSTPPFRPLEPSERTALQSEIERLRPDVLWVGLGTPKQERFMAAEAGALAAGLLIGVGAAFDFHSGRVRQAPRWIQRSGCEWLFRLGTEPGRLGPRYLRENPAFALRASAQRLGLVKYSMD